MYLSKMFTSIDFHYSEFIRYDLTPYPGEIYPQFMQPEGSIPCLQQHAI